MTRAAHALYFTALSIWVGGLASLAFVAAPMIFRNSPSRAVAGAIFGPILRTFAWVELACALMVVASSIILAQSDPRGLRGEPLRLALVAVMVLLLCSYAFGVYPAVAEERSRLSGFDAIPEGDPARARFDRLHRWSTRLVGANLLLGTTLLVLSGLTIRSS